MHFWEIWMLHHILWSLEIMNRILGTAELNSSKSGGHQPCDGYSFKVSSAALWIGNIKELNKIMDTTCKCVQCICIHSYSLCNISIRVPPFFVTIRDWTFKYTFVYFCIPLHVHHINTVCYFWRWLSQMCPVLYSICAMHIQRRNTCVFTVHARTPVVKCTSLMCD